mmetsp:Transcript_30975/g.100966  ORF Transcript_30975/g.100966 Transcript_30975/m.100966 type:complete len:225 (+) Transcript_30975:171-845(+)
MGDAGHGSHRHHHCRHRRHCSGGGAGGSRAAGDCGRARDSRCRFHAVADHPGGRVASLRRSERARPADPIIVAAAATAGAGALCDGVAAVAAAQLLRLLHHLCLTDPHARQTRDSGGQRRLGGGGGEGRERGRKLRGRGRGGAAGRQLHLGGLCGAGSRAQRVLGGGGGPLAGQRFAQDARVRARDARTLRSSCWGCSQEEDRPRLWRHARDPVAGLCARQVNR